MIQVFDSIDSFSRLNTPCAVALGFFDGVHSGHRAVIAKAVGGDAPMSVVLTFRESPSAILGQTPTSLLLTNDEKTRRLEHLGVDAVIYADFASICQLSAEAFVHDILCERLHARAVYCGFNYRFGRGGAATGDELIRLCRQHAVYADCCEPVLRDGEPVSSTRIRRLLECGEIEAANRLLTEPYALEGHVTEGNHIGTALGFPTVNLPLAPTLTVPRYGVYAARVCIDGSYYPGATNIGVHPSAGAELHPLCETFILGFDGDLYGRAIRISLLRFLRPERRFESLDELRTQVADDCAAVEAMRDELLP